MSTLSVAFARELEQAHAEAGIAYIAAPVMGRPDVAAAGNLNILAADDPIAIERARPENVAAGRRTA
jgi:3-hydroxyisobutyrate dehydrogenase-like beta-hydroxyacid dehydrogenase